MKEIKRVPVFLKHSVEPNQVNSISAGLSYIATSRDE